MPSTALNQAHKQAREALDELGQPWKISGSRLAYTASLLLRNGRCMSADGKSQLNAMRELRAKFDAAEANKAA